MESNHIAHELLARAHPPERAATIFKEKVLYRPLLIRPSSPDLASQDARAIRRLKRVRAEEKSRKNRTPKPLSAKQKRILGVYDIPKEQQKYELYVPLNKMWIGYMQEILDMKQGGSFVKTQFVGPKLASADFHGAEIEVVRCRDVGRVGCKGIVIKDTKFTFEVVTRADKLIVVPKKYTVFRFNIPQLPHEDLRITSTDHLELGESIPVTDNLVFEIHGSQFDHRAIDRATRKFKQQKNDDV